MHRYSIVVIGCYSCIQIQARAWRLKSASFENYRHKNEIECNDYDSNLKLNYLYYVLVTFVKIDSMPLCSKHHSIWIVWLRILLSVCVFVWNSTMCPNDNEKENFCWFPNQFKIMWQFVVMMWFYFFSPFIFRLSNNQILQFAFNCTRNSYIHPIIDRLNITNKKEKTNEFHFFKFKIIGSFMTYQKILWWISIKIHEQWIHN